MWGSKKKAKEVNLAENSSKNESKDIGKRHVGLFSGMMSGETLAKHVEFLAIKIGQIPRKDEYYEPLENERWGCWDAKQTITQHLKREKQKEYGDMIYANDFFERVQQSPRILD
jgi:hypothetical protein